MLVHKYQTSDEVAFAAAERTVAVLADAVRQYGEAVWVLAGGSSPLVAYRYIVERYANALDWSRVAVLIGDERLVPYDSMDSNWGQIILIIEGLGVRTIAPNTNLDAQAAAEDYERQLLELSRSDNGAPRFDAVWLGVGEDGHTLSLFPDHPDFVPTDRLVIAVHDSPKPPSTRISITFAALKGARLAFIFATGAAKREALARAQLTGDVPIAQAAHVIEQSGGEVVWLYDKAAL